VTGTPSKTVTATWTNGGSGTISSADIWIAEFSGNATSSVLETDATHSYATGTTSVVLPSITTSNIDLMISCASTSGNVSTANSPWTGFTGGVPANGNYGEYYIQTVNGAQAVAYTIGGAGGAVSSLEAAFKPGSSDTLAAQVCM
jgi:hypothetical protein